MAFTKTGPIIPFCKVPVLSFDILPEDIDRSSGNMSKLNTGTLQKGIIGPVLVNAINNSSIWILDK